MVFPANIRTGKIAPDSTGKVRFTTLSGGPYPCGAWAVTYLGNVDTDDNDRDHEHHRSDGHQDQDLRQIDRMGNPAVNTALIPAALKDSFSFGETKDDPKDFLGVIANQILKLDRDVFKTCSSSATSAADCNPNVPLLASVAVPDTLKFALDLPDGFPNGWQLFDRTTDTLISLILQVPDFTDGTSAKHYCLPSPTFPQTPAKFPFLAPPLQLTDGAVPPAQPSTLPCP
jgi:hypothetical protein